MLYIASLDFRLWEDTLFYKDIDNSNEYVNKINKYKIIGRRLIYHQYFTNLTPGTISSNYCNSIINEYEKDDTEYSAVAETIEYLSKLKSTGKRYLNIDGQHRVKTYEDFLKSKFLSALEP